MTTEGRTLTCVCLTHLSPHLPAIATGWLLGVVLRFVTEARNNSGFSEGQLLSLIERLVVASFQARGHMVFTERLVLDSVPGSAGSGAMLQVRSEFSTNRASPDLRTMS